MNSDYGAPIRPLEPRPKAIIVGASSGIGEALARRLASEGYVLALLARREDRLRDICDEINMSGVGLSRAYTHDVLDTENIPSVYRKVMSELGGLDLFVYAAGITFPSDQNVYDSGNDALVLRVNLIGAIVWLNLVGERFMQAREGHIVGLGSVAGCRGRRGMPAYAASKAGLHTYLEGLRNRIACYGVTVTTVLAGQVNTEMLKNAEKVRGPISVERAAELVWRAIRRRRQTVYIPAWWSLVCLVIRHIPSFIFRRLNI